VLFVNPFKQFFGLSYNMVRWSSKSSWSV